jgi:hypothetical protein
MSCDASLDGRLGKGPELRRKSNGETPHRFVGVSLLKPGEDTGSST